MAVADSLVSSLKKVLELEARQGFLDRSVTSGLESFVSAWEKRSQSAPIGHPSGDGAAGIVKALSGYHSADSTRRKAKVDAALGLLQALESGQDHASKALAPARARANHPGKDTSQRHRQEIGAPAAGTGEAREKPVRPVRRSVAVRGALTLDSPLSHLPNVGTTRASLFKQFDILTIDDLLHFYPRKHDDYSSFKKIGELAPGEVGSLVVDVWDMQERRTSRRPIFKALLADASGTAEATWFNRKLVRGLVPGDRIVVSGKLDIYLGHRSFASPTWEKLDKELLHTGRLVPVYPSKEAFASKLGERWMRAIVRQAIDSCLGQVRDHIPEPVLKRAGLVPLPRALEQIHFPDSQQSLEAARRRLAFDEFLVIQIGLLQSKRRWQEISPGQPIAVERALIDRFIARLPFSLTGAQVKAADQILKDLGASRPMRRLLQGDVGSGKTVVACTALVAAAGNGFQGAVMVPTEILAEQHYKNISNLLAGFSVDGNRPLRVALLTGKMRQSEKRQAYEEIASGGVDVVIGTHALIQEGVTFNNLGLVIVDEQHRFGVLQRETLRGKGFNPHMLVMTATPIPRSLALTIYGDLEISTIGELPPGRQHIKTRWLEPHERAKAYQFVRKEVALGHQVFVICPLVEESEAIEAKAATAEFERLQSEVFPELKVGLVHGRMRPSDKNAVMESFHKRELDVLVSTSVVEVGIDVPNATVMMVEGADRFGLSQLHQFRGRVGRGDAQSYCLLLTEKVSEAGKARLQIIEQTDDGFRLAEEDLKLRGPGEFFGTRQSGLPDLKVARLSDMAVLEMARREAQVIFAEDPELASPQYAMLGRMVKEFWEAREGTS
ncbi:MAG: ATP-dependent DNA helicase RecG [Chloroflexi bacterium]|nr:ATP-dependent DNA helicase RecG [Chloroflexota bacterium]